MIEGEIFHEISHYGTQVEAQQVMCETEEQDFAPQEVHEEQHIAGEPASQPTHND